MKITFDNLLGNEALQLEEPKWGRMQFETPDQMSQALVGRSNKIWLKRVLSQALAPSSPSLSHKKHVISTVVLLPHQVIIFRGGVHRKVNECQVEIKGDSIWEMSSITTINPKKGAKFSLGCWIAWSLECGEAVMVRAHSPKVNILIPKAATQIWIQHVHRPTALIRESLREIQEV